MRAKEIRKINQKRASAFHKNNNSLENLYFAQYINKNAATHIV